MTARSAAAVSSVLLACGLLVAGCTDYYEIPIETPIQPKMDVTGFQRVLVAGFIAGGTEDLDPNLETVRLLRSQLRTKSPLRVIEAEVLPLAEIAADSTKENKDSAVASASGAAPGAAGLTPIASPPPDGRSQTNGKPAATPESQIKTEKDFQKYDKIFADVSYWKKLGEEYQNPLIVTGTVLFAPQQTAGFVTREQEVFDATGRRRVIPIRAYMERKGFMLIPKFIFIDGRTGATLYSETFREEVLYNAQQNTPALSSYFELMDRVIPSFLSTLSAQKIRGTRVLLK
jgi:hypothetical protein